MAHPVSIQLVEIPDQALSEAVANMLLKDGVLPGLEAALAAAPDMSEGGVDLGSGQD